METTNQENKKQNVYDIINGKIVALLEQGVVPWKKMWTDSGIPQNLISLKPYRGINVWLLASLNYKLNFFLTYRQAKELGGAVRKGEKGHIVVFTKWIEETDPVTFEKKQKSLLRYYMVFNVKQCDGIPPEKIPTKVVSNEVIPSCGDIVKNMPNCPPIMFLPGGPYYNPVEDFINMPHLYEFENSEEFYCTVFHEMIHSTGHHTRLCRDEVINNPKFGSELYSLEELTAEIGSCYLSSLAGIKNPNLNNSAAYIQGWLKKLKGDPRCIVYASAQAQRAVEFILNIVPEVPLPKETEVEHEQ